ncbi:MAG: hypothetical protein LBR52_01205 [Prevotellaceae bacterium]|jgi:hypothetical protein|nr:hypothetical protein [Prevotellaceae bacterium]
MNIILKSVFAALPFLFFAACDKEGKERNDPHAYVTSVFDYHYAPGQHVEFAKKPDWINGEYAASDILLGGWGGYVVLGFDHDVQNTEGKNLIIHCGGSAAPEPGIIYLMDDANGNGLPDDEWFEIKGSETGHKDCIRDYTLTYYKPENANDPVTWRDKFGNEGVLPGSGKFSIRWWKDDADSVVFTGTRLPDAYYNSAPEGKTEYWEVYPDLFKYGYAENGKGSGKKTAGDYSEKLRGNLIDITDAIDKEGKPAQLQKIRFVKIQTGVFQQAGDLGEISTEAGVVGDLSLLEK